MRRKKEKGYWIKKSEKFNNASDAKTRAGELRAYACICGHMEFLISGQIPWC